jgi:hypothetical protein
LISGVMTGVTAGAMGFIGAAALIAGLRFAALFLAGFFFLAALRAGLLFFAAFFFPDFFFFATRFLDERFLDDFFFAFLAFLEDFFFAAFFFAAMVLLLSMLTDCLSCAPPDGWFDALPSVRIRIEQVGEAILCAMPTKPLMSTLTI